MQLLATWVLIGCGLAICGIGLGLPFTIRQLRRDRADRIPIEWPAAKVSRTQALERDTFIQTHVTANRLGDKRRRTAVTTGVIQTIPAEITPLPVHEDAPV